MTDNLSTQDVVIAEFLEKLESGSDPNQLIDEFAAKHPELRGEFQRIVQLTGIVFGAKNSPNGSLPNLPGFQILREIARGGMGVVYEAVQEPLGRHVAVKVRLPQLTAMAEERFNREQQVLARLHHTNIVPIHLAGRVGDVPYYVMEYIDGASLRTVVHATREFETTRPGGDTPSLPELAKASGNSSSKHSVVRRSPRLPKWPKRSMKYYRSVAHLLAEIADGLHHAHCEGVLHRDINPSNIMVDSLGRSRLMDFGLARCNGKDGAPEDTGGNGHGTPGDAFTRDPIGTRQYMAPEQFEPTRPLDARCDVWALGATLYELLTLQQAFWGETYAAVRQKVTAEQPTPVRELVANAPRDLVAICNKALKKEPEKRYGSAREFLADLRRWLQHEPTIARPAHTVRRMLLWARRNPAWTAALAMSIVALVAIGTGMIFRERGWAAEADFQTTLAIANVRESELRAATSEAEAEAAKTAAQAAEAEAAAANEREQAQFRESLLIQLQSLRLLPHTDGWSDKAEDRVRQIADVAKDRTLPDQLAASLIGIDAHKTKRFEFDASTVAFDSDGSRIIMGGMNDRDGKPITPATLWDPQTDETLSSAKAGAGPVAFLRDGTSVQLVQEGSTSLVLWNIVRREAIGEFAVPAPKSGVPLNIVEIALAPDGSLVAASAISLDEHERPDPKAGGMIAVWESQSGKLLHRFDGLGNALAFSPDAQLLAASDENRGITVWSLSDGKLITTMLPQRKNAIHCLAFGRDPRGLQAGERREADSPWRLAVGGAGGLVTIWDLAGRVQAYCYGSSYDVNTVAFSPDGTLLAAAGRGKVKLWDAATGRFLLDLKGSNYITSLAFSADGRKLAVCGFVAFQVPGGVDVWEVENGRGIETLRGLAAPIKQVYFSRDGKLVAALSQDWQVGIWDVGAGRLVRVIDTPRGFFADNAALAFSEDGNLIAFATATEARIWDIATGEQRKSVRIPPGLADLLAFHSSGKLLHFRVEQEDGKALPSTKAELQQRPRVCQIRDLLAEDPLMPLATIRDFNWHVFSAAASPDGRYFAVEGARGPDGKQRWIKAFDGPTGAELLFVESTSKIDGASLVTDPSGDWLFIDPDYRSKPTLVAMPSGKFVESLDYSLHCLGPGATYRAVAGPQDGRGMSLIRRGDNTPIVSVGIDNEVTTVLSAFNGEGTHLAWGNPDGTVLVCDIRETQRRLAAVGLGW